MVDCGLNDAKSRFVCPNDRQLALRAKLKTGWSVKTASFGGYQEPPAPLDRDEQDTILEVIKRAEQVEQNEQERVGKLVERLENLRRNALGRNSSQCLLCGSAFGIIGAQKVVCVDCRKYVCQKCAIDGCSARHSSSKDHWLCMICAETREIWKKSGAWFFKTLPKYVTPAQQAASYRDRARSLKVPKTRSEDSSSEDEKKPWGCVERRNSSTESSHDFDLGDSKSHSDARGSKDVFCSSKDLCSHFRESSTLKDFHTTGSMRCKDALGSRTPKDAYVLPKDAYVLPKEYQPLVNYLPSPGYYDHCKSYSSSCSSHDARNWDFDESKVDSVSIEGSEVSRRESVASKSTSELYWSDGRCDDKPSPTASSTSSGVFKTIEEHKPVDVSMGIMELSLTYDAVTSTLHCTVYRAKNLIPMDINGLADPFCKLNILPTSKTSTRLRTKTVHKTRNPEFNENLTFYDITENDLMKKSLHVLVVDDDKFGHDYMGETRIPLPKLKVQSTIYLTVPLERLRIEQKGPMPLPDMNQWFDDLWSRGQILLSLQYNTKRRSLLVTVLRCSNLLPMDNNGFSDPFVKLSLRPDPSHRKYKTSIKWKNLNPVFNEEFAFDTRPTELPTQSLYITVWDKDYGKSNDYLGGLIIGGVGSKGQRLKQWLDVIKYPNHNHVCWHNLAEENLPD